MDVAIVAPCPVPYVRGGAENHWLSLQDHVNEQTPHRAEIIKLPSREHEFWDLIESYRTFSTLDLHEFDLVLSGKYPAWMVGHHHHVVHLLHPLRGLYDTYHFSQLPDAYPDPPAAVAQLLAFCAAHPRQRDALPEFFARMESLKAQRESLATDLFAFPGPLIRTLVHWLDGVALAPAQIVRYGAISQTVKERADYFPAGVEVFVVHPSSRVRREPGGRHGDHVLSVGRLDGPKRVELLIEAMAHVQSQAPLVIVGSGPVEPRLRELAAGNSRVRFEGEVSEARLSELYARARAVAYIPYEEDFGLVTLEAMQSARPVITCRDSGGPLELVQDGVTGLVVEPGAPAIAAAIDRLWASRGEWRRMGKAALECSRPVTWAPLVRELEAAAG
jgi:glycosyltransferase involved in cell wall biosynthesis